MQCVRCVVLTSLQGLVCVGLLLGFSSISPFEELRAGRWGVSLLTKCKWSREMTSAGNLTRALYVRGLATYPTIAVAQTGPNRKLLDHFGCRDDVSHKCLVAGEQLDQRTFEPPERRGGNLAQGGVRFY